MKKTLLFIILTFFLSGTVAFAQQAGNPVSLIKQGEIGVGVRLSDIFTQNFEHYDLKRKYSDGTRISSRKRADFENDKYFMMTFTYGIMDQLNLFATLGVVDGGKIIDRQTDNDWQGELESNFVWALGAKGKIFEFDNGLGFSLAAWYTRYDNRSVTNWKSKETGRTAEDLGWSTDDELDYWQVDAIASAYWKIKAFTPYVGLGYTYCDVNYDGRWTQNTDTFFEHWVSYDGSFTNDDNLTVLIGLDVELGAHFKTNIQGTFVSSTAITAGISYSF
jgi:outer membrane protein W